MKRTEKTIIRKIKNSEFVITTHARQRMNERFISELDIIEVAKTVRSISYQENNDTYLIVGRSTWKQELALSAALRDEVIIVTVFFEE